MFWSGLLALLWLAVGSGQEFDTSRYPESLICFNDTVKRGTQTLKLQYHDWDSHSVVRWLVAIILRESLGYNVEFVDSTGVPTIQTFQSIANKVVDIDAEVWAASKRDAYDKFVVSLGLAQDLGELGTAGLERLYVTSEITQDDDCHPPEYYRSYKNTSRPFRILASDYFSATGAPIECTDKPGSFSPDCTSHTQGRYACRADNFPAWECQQGIWYSDTCCNATAKTCASDLSALTKCVEVWYPDPGWTTGIFEQSLQNLNIPVSFVYLGDPKTYQLMVEEILRDKNYNKPLWYWFEPDPWLNRLRKEFKVELFVLPPWTNDCFETVVANPNGPINCDSQVDFVKKIARNDLKSVFPNAFQFLKQLQVKKADYDFMFDVLNSDKTHFEAACEFARVLRFERPSQFNLMVVPPTEYTVTVSNRAAAALVVFVSFGLVVSGALLAVFYRYRNSKTVIRRSGVYFMSLQVLGIALIMLGSVMALIELSVAACAARDWLLALGYTLSFSTLFSKNWRVYRIMKASKNLKQASITNRDLIPVISGLVGTTLVLLCLIEGMRHHELHKTQSSDLFGVNVTCPHMSEPGQTLLGIYIVLLTIWGTVLAVRNMNLKGEFNESRAAALAVYTLAICIVVILLFVALLHDDPLNLTLVLAGLEVFVAWASLIILFAPAIYYLWRELSGRMEEAISHATSDPSNSNPQSKPTVVPCSEPQGSRVTYEKGL